ncbi:DUF1223 domain-containing protein [Lichenihabitans psoromatis]|uniref:DUF1223 domain-containing protein n=1 Tax=Lichenihabitans psoromatis TaxID=2528642 RepID=UPI0010383380|nr:DUF1223 domain-containing protein [Lichenihabitans psoromatis]
MLSRLFASGFALLLLPAAALTAERPVVVELFTSEGCSSCPPADAYLTDLSHAGRDVLPLAFHVTYWNGLGWRDPFSLDAATQRQARYGSRFGDGSYTPEMVVDGAHGFVGSERGAVGAAIREARQNRTAASVSVSRQDGQISIAVGAGSGTGRLLLIGFDTEHRTAVGRGENTGRTLTESNIVRSIRPVGQWSGAPVTFNAALPVGQDVAVILEAPDGRIVGATRLGDAS